MKYLRLNEYLFLDFCWPILTDLIFHFDGQGWFWFPYRRAFRESVLWEGVQLCLKKCCSKLGFSMFQRGPSRCCLTEVDSTPYFRRMVNYVGTLEAEWENVKTIFWYSMDSGPMMPFLTKCYISSLLWSLTWLLGSKSMPTILVWTSMYNIKEIQWAEIIKLNIGWRILPEISVWGCDGFFSIKNSVNGSH